MASHALIIDSNFWPQFLFFTNMFLLANFKYGFWYGKLLNNLPNLEHAISMCKYCIKINL